MGWRFRRSVKILPGVRMNISKRGVSSWSFGRPGYTVNVSNRGVKRTVGIPGTGLSYTDTVSSASTAGNADLREVRSIPATDQPSLFARLGNAIRGFFGGPPEHQEPLAAAKTYPSEMLPSLFARHEPAAGPYVPPDVNDSLPRAMADDLFSSVKTNDRLAWDFGGADFTVEAVGESEFQPSLRALRANRLDPDGTFLVAIIPLSSNDAFEVRLNAGGTLGYLSKRDTAAYREVLALAAANGRLAACRGRLTGGVAGRSLGVVLNFKSPVEIKADILETLGQESRQEGAPPAGGRFL